MSGGEAPSHPWIETQTPSSAPTSTLSKGQSEAEEDATVEGRERRKLKNEDSSYDSDFDACESLASPRAEEDAHEDVSRTTSETLGAEFEDYITQPQTHNQTGLMLRHPGLIVLAPGGPTSRPPQPTTTAHQPGIISSPPALTVTEATPQPTSTPLIFPFPPSAPATGDVGEASPHSLAAVVESAEYPQQVEFGVKLGYSEALVQLALTKLGPNPDKNELLDELIRLGAGAPRSDCDEEAGEGEEVEQPALRQIIIDGSNVAMSHGNKVKFSCKGIRLCVDWCRARGHKEILVFVPMWRKEQSRLDSIITDQEVLQELEKEGVLSFTPSRSCGGKRIVSYDDRYIIKEALKSDGVIVSNDNYRDLINENPAFRKVIETSLLMYSWVNGRFEPPDDPLGRNGPSLDVFLRKPTGSVSSLAAKDTRPCPYGRKCTYGNKCKYMHPERGAAPVKSVTEILQEQKQKHYQDKAKSRDSSPGECLRAKSLSLPVATSESCGAKKPLTRTQSTFPSISLAQTSVTKEGTILEYSRLVSSASSETPCTTIHSPATSQTSVDSLCGSILKGDSLYSLCPSQMSLRPSLSWQSQEGGQTSQAPKMPPLPYVPRVSEHEGVCGENLHPKLQRQLSLNPVGDDRLAKFSKPLMANPSGDYVSLMSTLQQQQQQQQQQQKQQLLSTQMLQPPPSQQQQTQQQQQQQQPSQSHHRLLESDMLGGRSCIGTRCISPRPAFSHGYGSREMMQTYLHPPLTRHSSSQEGKPSFSQHILSPCFHNPVGRNLSAPDPIRGGGQQQQQNIIPHITRLNSTSDSRLNIHGSATDAQQFTPECFDDSSLGRLSYAQMSLPSMSGNSPGAIGSRPMSPQTPSLAGMVPPSLPSSPRIPQHHPQPSSMGGMQHNLGAGSNTHEDERLKIFYHLSQLFPESHVRAALGRNPDETDPTKICMSILSMSGYRPVSPQQMSAGGVSHPALGPTLSLRGSTFGTSFSAPSTNMETAREVARMEAYSKLTKLFPEDQVRNIMLRYPDETDPTKLCMLLMYANPPQS